MRLAKKGQLLTHHKDKAVLTLMKVENVVETDFVSVRPEMDLGELVKAISTSHRNMFPVTDKDGGLLGVVLLDDIRNNSCPSGTLHRFTVSKLRPRSRRLYDTDSMEQVCRLLTIQKRGTYLWSMKRENTWDLYPNLRYLIHIARYWYISRKIDGTAMAVCNG